jgi:hypothetical protein
MIRESLETLPIGHYGVGVADDGHEVDIYRASVSEIWNVATGLPVAIALAFWRRSDGPRFVHSECSPTT